MSRFRLLSLMILMLCQPLQAEVGVIQGVILDRTTSMNGHEFFDKFFYEWMDVPQAENVNVTIMEQHSPRKGNSVLVYVDETIVYQVALTPRKSVESYKIDAAKRAAMNAARRPSGPTIF